VAPRRAPEAPKPREHDEPWPGRADPLPGESPADDIPADGIRADGTLADGTLADSAEHVKGRGGLEKGIKVLIFAVASVLVLELVWLLVISPCMPLSRIEVSGFPGLERVEILSRGGIGERSSFVSVDRRAVEGNLERIPRVESAMVTKHFPGTIKILVLPRTAVAMAFAVEAGRRIPIYVDRQGVAFTNPHETRSLPIISGLVLEEGTSLSALYLPLFTSLDRIRSVDAELLGAVSEIMIHKKPFNGFDLVLYPVHSPIRVRLESTLNEETLRYVMLMLDVLDSRKWEIEELDFRSGTGSYRVKEVSFGQ
jgi:cell division protein FtsQ